MIVCSVVTGKNLMFPPAKKNEDVHWEVERSSCSRELKHQLTVTLLHLNGRGSNLKFGKIWSHHKYHIFFTISKLEYFIS